MVVFSMGQDVSVRRQKGAAKESAVCGNMVAQGNSPDFKHTGTPVSSAILLRHSWFSGSGSSASQTQPRDCQVRPARSLAGRTLAVGDPGH
mmetsp:Transcript_11165/g.35627  ORF Transcript_11165/g.35627 Transcript_11165/m.35627 type:complete len:91 (-) Transcript_11165:1429-1701(-)